MGEINSFTKVSFTGNTKLTLECVKATMLTKEVVAIFGLPDNDLKGKTNSVTLDSFCERNNIKLFKSGDWDEYKIYCEENGVELVITIGDSRIVPTKIIDNFYTIGNHGAILPDAPGGASLVWGRLVNSGEWGISIMKIGQEIDSGEILKTKKFKYDYGMSEQEFCDLCDRTTVDTLKEVLLGNYVVTQNKKPDVKLIKHIDTEKAVDIIRFCLDNGLTVYTPPRTQEDSIIKDEWSEEFKELFKVAQNAPYPKYIEGKTDDE